jgi:hypothetical protein
VKLINYTDLKKKNLFSEQWRHAPLFTEQWRLNSGGMPPLLKKKTKTV